MADKSMNYREGFATVPEFPKGLVRTEIEYPIKLEAKNEKAYDEVSRYLGEASHHVKNIEGRLHYFFNEEQTKVIRTDGKNKLEISDLVSSDIVDSIKHILKSEKRGDDLI